MKKLIEKLLALFAKLFGKKADAPVSNPVPAPTPAPAPPVATKPVAPPSGVVVRNGARFSPTAPIALDWLPPHEATIMYGTYLPDGPICPEDRIAVPAGARSPKGYPMVNGRVSFNGGLWANDGEVVDYITRVAARGAALQKWQEEFSSVRYVGTSGIDAATVHENRDETKYLWDVRQGYLGDLHRVVLSGLNVDISRCINNGFYDAGSVNLGVRAELIAAVDEALAAQARGEAPVYRTL